MLAALLPLALAASLPETTRLTDAWSCDDSAGLPGPEDLDVVELDGRRALLVSSDQRRPEGDTSGSPTPSGEGPDGGLYAIDWETREVRALPIAGRDACSFHPHGIDTRVGADGLDIYVVNHFAPADATRDGCALAPNPRGGFVLDAVEHLRYANGALRFVERLQSPLMTEPNDIFALDDGGLLVSNNPEYTLVGLFTGVTLGRRPSDVLGYDGKGAWTVATRRFLYSNGVFVDAAGRLWVATYAGHLFGYERTADGWARSEHIQLQGALDNIMQGDDGRLLVAGHPQPLVFPKHAKDATLIGPSVVYALEPSAGGWQPVARLLDESGAVNASSTAVQVDDALVFGIVFDEGPVICTPR